MGLISIICSNCAGKGTIEPEGGEFFHPFAKPAVICPECDGEGSQLVHTGSIQPYRMEVDPSGANEDETWQVVWDQLDDGSIDVVDMFKIGENQ